MGAFLAELCVFYCHHTLNYKTTHAVTFESPGSRESLEKLQSNLGHELIDLNRLDIVAYVSTPNLINTCNNHIGTLYAAEPDLGDYGWVAGWYLKQAHSMSGIVSWFEVPTVATMKYLSDWPVGLQRDIFFHYAELQDGHYVLTKSEEELTAATGGELTRNMHELYERTYKAHLVFKEEYSGPQVLALKHFTPAMQAFLKAFSKSLYLISNTEEQRTALKEKWKEARVPELLFEDLTGYVLTKNAGGTEFLQVRLEGVSVFKFRRRLSKALADQGEELVKLLSLVKTSTELTEIIACILAPGAEMSGAATIENAVVRGMELEIPEGATKDEIDNIDRLARSVLSTTSRLSAYILAPGAKMMGGTITGASATGIRVTTVPRGAGLWSGGAGAGPVDEDKSVPISGAAAGGAGASSALAPVPKHPG